MLTAVQEGHLSHGAFPTCAFQELSEEVSDHQKQVDELSGSGQELMRHASGNDAIQLKERLDSLQLRYSDLAQRAAERLRQAKEALPVAQGFHSAHERLVLWMDEAEAQLRSFEAAALVTQESTMQVRAPLVD